MKCLSMDNRLTSLDSGAMTCSVQIFSNNVAPGITDPTLM